MTVSREVEFMPVDYCLNGLSYRGIATGNPDAPLIIAIHGWLDNAATFAPLMPYLSDYRFVSLDMPGHGESAHWSSPVGKSYPYHYSDMIVWMTEITQQILAEHGRSRDEKPILLGHSLGGTVATMVAGILPEQFQRLVLIESVGPFTAADSKLPEQMRQSIKLQLRESSGNLRLFNTVAEAIARRMDERNAGGAISEEAAQHLVSRGLVEREGGYQWRSDPKLLLPSPHRFTEAQVRATIREIQIPTLIIEGDAKFLSAFPESQERIELFKAQGAQHHVIPGRHHLHMENPKPVAAAIRAFLR